MRFPAIDESKEGFLRYQLLRLGAGSDEEGPLEAESDDDWGDRDEPADYFAW